MEVKRIFKTTESQQPVAEGAGIIVTENGVRGDQNPDRVVEPKRSKNNKKGEVLPVTGLAGP